MNPETVRHPDLTALVATNEGQDIRHVIHDWLMDRSEDDLAARVLACETAVQVEAVIGSERLAFAFREIAARMSEANANALRGLTAVGKVMADSLRPLVQKLTAAFSDPAFAEAVKQLNEANRKAKK